MPNVNKPTYLETLNSAVNIIFTEDVSVETFMKDVTTGYFPLYGEFDVKASVAKLDRMIEVLERMLSIVRKPMFHTREEETVMRSELSPSLDSLSFRETMRTPSFWKEKDGEMEPEFVDTHTGEDDYCIYENKFIFFLADRIKKDIFEIESQSDRFYFSLLGEYQSDAVTYARPSFLTTLNVKGDYPYPHVFSSTSSQTFLLDEKLKKARRYMSHIFRSSLYREVSKYEISPNIMPTNILLHDNLYGFCYRYYKETYQKEGEKQLGDDILYYDFVIGDMMLALSKDGFDVKGEGVFTYTDEGRIEMPKLTFALPKVTVEIEDVKDASAFKVTGYMVDKRGNRLGKTKKLVYVHKEMNKTDSKKVYEDVERLMKEEDFDDYSIVTMSNRTNVYDRVACVTYYDRYSAGVLNNVLKSCFLCFTFEKESDVRCPICGSNEIQNHENHCRCLNCNGTYTIYEMENEYYLMIEKLWRSEEHAVR